MESFFVEGLFHKSRPEGRYILSFLPKKRIDSAMRRFSLFIRRMMAIEGTACRFSPRARNPVCGNGRTRIFPLFRFFRFSALIVLGRIAAESSFSPAIDKDL